MAIKGSDDRPHPTSVRVDGCHQAPCHITQGTTAHMEIDFRAPFDADNLRPHVNATVFGVELEYPLGPEFHDACSHLVSGCPLVANQDTTYTFLFEVTKYYPAVSVIVQLSLYDAMGYVHFCTRIPVQVDIA